MNINGLKNRKAVGTIIGGVFVLLIFSSIIATFAVIDFNSQTRDEVAISRTEFYNEKTREDIQVITSKKIDYSLNITIKNTGDIATKIVYIGELDKTSINQYHKIDILLMPLETATDILPNTIIAETGITKDIQILTSYGNQYFHQYNEITGNQNLFELVINVIGVGTTTPSEGTHNYQEGADVSVTAYPSTGWSLNHWVIDGVSGTSDNPTIIDMDSNHNITAVFNQNNIILIEDNFNNLDNWDTTNWEIQNDEYVTAASSARSDSNNEGNLQCKTLNTSNATSINLVFWYRLSGGIDSNDISLQFYDGLGGPDTIEYLDGLENTWRLYNYTTSDPQYFIPNFYIRFDSSLGSNEMVWIDDVKVTISQ